jgi:hypothetical protein
LLILEDGQHAARWRTLMEAAVSAGINAAMTAAGQSYNGRQMNSYRGGRLPFPDRKPR